MKLNVKWVQGKQTLEGLEADVSDPPLVFKSQVWTLTGVPPERQKLMFKGKQLKDDGQWSDLGVTDNATLMLMGTADALPQAPTEKPVFLEDLGREDHASLSPPGLANLGNTCYLNASLQCFRASPELVKLVKSYDPSATSESQAAVVGMLRDVFTRLDNVKEATVVNPMFFVATFRSAFPQFAQQTNHGYSQQDAEEAFSQLMTCMANSLKDLPADAPVDAKNPIDALFGGRALSTYKCIENDAEPEEVKQETFLKMSCHITNTIAHISESLRLSMEEILEKNSPTLGRTANYKKTTRITRLPAYLTVQFVRFWYNRKENVKAKILRKVAYSERLDMLEFCSDDLKKKLDARRHALRLEEEKRLGFTKDAPKAEGSASSSGPSSSSSAGSSSSSGASASSSAATDSAAQPAASQEIEMIDPNFTETGIYELSAVLTHKGRDANSGHYVSWVKQTDNSWLKFDDDKVSRHTVDEVRDLAGGGDWHMAYLLIYKHCHDKV